MSAAEGDPEERAAPTRNLSCGRRGPRHKTHPLQGRARRGPARPCPRQEGSQAQLSPHRCSMHRVMGVSRLSKARLCEAAGRDVFQAPRRHRLPSLQGPKRNPLWF